MGATILLALVGFVMISLASFAKLTVNDNASDSVVGWVRLLLALIGALCWRFA